MWEGRTGKYLARIYNARAEKAQKRFCSKVLTFFFHSEQEDNNLSKNATFLISGFFFPQESWTPFLATAQVDSSGPTLVSFHCGFLNFKLDDRPPRHI